MAHGICWQSKNEIFIIKDADVTTLVDMNGPFV